MKIAIPSLLVVGVTLLLGVPCRVEAQLSAEVQASTVRIVCPQPAENGGKGFNVIPLKLSDDETASLVPCSFGSGFLINDSGFIVTNNHVVAAEEDKEVPSPLVLIMQKVGDHYVLHRAAILWQSANADLAVIRAPTFKAKPLPLQFDENKSTPSEEVFSMGFPGIADAAEDDSKRSDEVTTQFTVMLFNIRLQRAVEQLHRKLRNAEIEAIKRDVLEHSERISADWMDLMAALDTFLKNADGSVTAWDVTDVIAHKSLWADYFRPTVTRGNIERFARIHGFLGATYPDVLMIQHSCAIKHGNSGGPLLNAGGQVIGVVGRGVSKTKDGETEGVQWAAAASELKSWLDGHQVPYIAGGEWRKPPETPQPIRIIEKEPVKIIQQLPTQIINQPTLKIVERLPIKVIVAVGLAVVLAIAAGVISFLRSNRKPSFTTILRDPRMAKLLGTTPSKLVAGDGGKSPASANGSPPGFSRWQLTGRTESGENVQVEMTDVMFTTNDYRLIVGRTVELCHVVVNDSSISKQHAHIRKDGDRFLVADRNSSNHTAVNGQFNRQVFEEVPLREGDTLTLGEVRLEFRKI